MENCSLRMNARLKREMERFRNCIGMVWFFCNGGKIEMISFLIGLIVGTFGSVMTMALCRTAANSDREMEEIMRRGKRE